ncbi:MAG: hypothetical protein DWI24_00365 [Planctomycetota bacterium]|nr:MAG: hypothetical protein DWI24_00365 [Planctomycetota bacterium]
MLTVSSSKDLLLSKKRVFFLKKNWNRRILRSEIFEWEFFFATKKRFLRSGRFDGSFLTGNHKPPQVIGKPVHMQSTPMLEKVRGLSLTCARLFDKNRSSILIYRTTITFKRN